MKYILCILLATTLTGCFHNAVKVTGDPQKTITLEEAFRSVGASLQALEKAKGDKMLGIATSEIEVKFNISSKATDTSKLEANAGTTSKVTGSSEVSNTVSSKETTGTNSENTSASSNSTSSENDGNNTSSSSSGGSKDSSTSGSETSESTTNSTKTTAETGVSANLKAEIGSSVEGSRSNSITVKLVSVPALISGLKQEQIDLLKYIGYFKKNQIQTNQNQVFFMVPEVP